MASFNIISASTRQVKATCHPVYHGTYLQPSYLEVSEISFPSTFQWEVGDYIIYPKTYRTYYLFDIPQPSKQASVNLAGDSISYSNVKFYDGLKFLERCPFRDLVYKDSAYYFSTLNSVSTFENVDGIMRRIVKNLEAFYGNAYDFFIYLAQNTIPDYEASVAKEFVISNGSCLDALNKIYEVWENLGYYFEGSKGYGFYIALGFNNEVVTGINTSPNISYGRGNGILSIKKSQSNVNEMATRLFCYGSSRNIVSRYYNNLKDASNNNIYQKDNVYIPNLMLPFTHDGNDVWGKTNGLYDASKCYLINSSAEETFGRIDKYVYFDGSDRDEIYPSIEKATIAQLRAAKSSTSTGAPNYYPSTSIYTDGTARLDEIDAVTSAPTDDGEISKDGLRASESYSGNISASSNAGTQMLDGAFSFYLTQHQFVNAQGLVNIGLTGNITFALADIEHTVDSITVYYQIEDSSGTVSPMIRFGAGTNGTSFSFPLPETISAGTTDRKAVGLVKVKIYLYSSLQAIPSSAVSVTYGNTAGTVKMDMTNLLSKTFTIKLRQIGFDMMARASLSGNSRPTIVMKDGQCIARNFEVKSASYLANEDKWSVVCYRGDDTSVGMRYPNTSYPIAAGDRFVLLDLAMPDEYVGMASERLYEAGAALLEELSRIEPFYEPSIDAKVASAFSDGDMMESLFMKVQDNDIASNPQYIIIDSLTIYEGESSIPTYKISLREKKRKSFIQSIESSIKSLSSEGGSSSITSSSTTSSVDYNSLQGLPSLNGVVIEGDKTSEDYGITGGGGVVDYSSLGNKPSINGVILEGNKVSSQLGLASEQHNHDTEYLSLNGGEVTGSISATGGFYDTSDDRLKDFDGDLKLSLEKINSISKKYFRYKADKTCKRFLGTSAQSLNEILPECVTKRSDGYFVVDYSKLSIVSLYAIGLLTKRIEMLEKNR